MGLLRYSESCIDGFSLAVMSDVETQCRIDLCLSIRLNHPKTIHHRKKTCDDPDSSRWQNGLVRVRSYRGGLGRLVARPGYVATSPEDHVRNMKFLVLLGPIVSPRAGTG